MNQQKPNIEAVRKLLRSAFTPGDLRRFLIDRPTFEEIGSGIPDNAHLDTIIDEVIKFCQNRLGWDKLLKGVEKERPEQFERFAKEIYLPPPPNGPRKSTPSRQLLPIVGLAVVLAVVVVLAVLILGSHREGDVETKAWDDLNEIEDFADFEGTAWFCQAATGMATTDCTFGSNAPKPGCYFLIAEDWKAWVDGEDAAVKLGAEYLSPGVVKEITAASGYGCGEPPPDSHWVLIDID